MIKHLLLAAAALVAASSGAVEVASPFADGMVLQRGMKIPVWGWAKPGEEVDVFFAGAVRKAAS